MSKKPTQPAKEISVEVVEEPKALVPAKSVPQWNAFQSSPEAVETAIMEALADEEMHRRASAISDLRAGVLFHLYKISLGVAGRKYTGFWDRCEEKFKVGRATISRKMRLALKWASDTGAKEKAIAQLALANLDDTNNPAVTLALGWIGDDTTSDLYRKHKLVNVGPTGGDRNSGKKLKRRTKTEKKFNDDASISAEWYEYGFAGISSAYLSPKETWLNLDDVSLANLADVLKRFSKEVDEVCRSRKVQPAKLANWQDEIQAEDEE